MKNKCLDAVLRELAQRGIRHTLYDDRKPSRGVGSTVAGANVNTHCLGPLQIGGRGCVLEPMPAEC